MPSAPAGTPSQKALVIGVSGVQYAALQQAIAQSKAPNLARLAIVPALAGGINGTMTQQATLAGPGWASVLTGTWANRHGVRNDYAGQAIQADTLFKRIKQAGPYKTAAFDSWSTLNALLAPAIAAGYVDTAVNCAGVDTCVIDAASKSISGGSADLVFANLSGPATVAASSGLQGDYSNALTAADQKIGQLLAAVSARQSQSGVNENWLVMVTTDEGLDATGTESGLPLLSNETAFIGSNQPLTAAGTITAPGTIAAAPTLAQLAVGATQADITPTVLGWFAVQPDPATYAMDGATLLNQSAPRALSSTPGADQVSLALSWTAPSTAPAQYQLYRDGTLIATLPGDASSYIDSTLGKTASGLYTFNYTLVANGVAVSSLAQINYVQPVLLDSTLTGGLIHFFSFDKGLTDAITPGVLLQQFNTASTTTQTLVADNFSANAMQVASLITGSGALNGMKLADDVSTNAQFSVGFWFKSDDKQNDSPAIGDKDWASGLNPGWTIAQESNGTFKFNIADGSLRADQSLNFSANAWVYVAMTVDTAALTATAYVDDPTYGLQAATLSLAGMNATKIKGVYSTIGLNEDARGTYYSRGNGVLGTMTFNDVAMWNKVITKQQVVSLFASKRSLSSLLP
ncbi:MAG TPA: LamG-like jellyroll fold domain-containing protein [Paraburkholderia sp.]|nr:LamG-like jellyroll fold domain-containing protein [Paraburkholderia sp.]